MIKKTLLIFFLLVNTSYAADSIGGGNIHSYFPPLLFKTTTTDGTRPRTIIVDSITDNGDGSISIGGLGDITQVGNCLSGICFASGSTADTVLSGTGTLILGGVDGVNNEHLTIDFETTPNRFIFGSDTGAIAEFTDEVVIGGTTQSLFDKGIIVNNASGGAATDSFQVNTDNYPGALLVSATSDTVQISGATFKVAENTVNLSDTTDTYVLSFDTATQTWRGAAAGAGGGDSVTVNSTAIDTTANIKDSTDVTWAITDGGAGGPDDIAGTVADDSHNHVISNIDAFSSAALYGQISDETGSASGSPLAVFSINPTLTGATLNGVLDAGGATSLEVPNTAGNVAVDAAGEVAVDSTNNQLVIYTDAEYVIPLKRVAQGTFDFTAQYDVDDDMWLVDLDAAEFPNGIYITAVSLDCTKADPTTEFQGDLIYCDAVANGAFPGANPTVIIAMDSTTGNFTNAAVNTSVATGKTIYVHMDADPTDTTTQWHLKITYRIEED